MTTLDAVDTPCLVLDRDILRRNLDRMRTRVEARGVRLRPHLKTAKSPDVALLATGTCDAPITVSTLREAEEFFDQGYRDIFYAVSLGPGKVARAARLLRLGARLVTCVDHPAAAGAVAAGAAREGVTFRCTIEIDCGEGRGGIAPGDDQLIPLARLLGAHYAGVMTHGGQSYSARTPGERHAVAEAEVASVRMAAARLAAAGWASPIVSIGSSPTALDPADLSGITELRAGVYMFWDLFQAGNGQCAIEDIAVSVLAEIIGRPRGRNEFIIDAGAFALSKDISTSALPPERQAGYGRVCEIGGRLIPGLKVTRVWQEHGLVVSEAPLSEEMFPLGSRVRILPNHACPTAAAHDRYQVVEGSREIVAEWPRFGGW
jgi:D-serine deaminase-like pyridoxal phosphate-dependent protein